jgi:hypothetical protein
MYLNMKPIILVIICSLLILLIASCKDEKNEDITQEVNKNGAVETAIEIKHLDSLNDVLITTHKIWVKNILTKEISYKDTIASLGKTSIDAENKDGDTKKVTINKEYEIFITVK